MLLLDRALVSSYRLSLPEEGFRLC